MSLTPDRYYEILQAAESTCDTEWIDLWADYGERGNRIAELEAERANAYDALSEQGRSAADVSGCLEDGINWEQTAHSAEVTGLVEELAVVRGERDRLAAQLRQLAPAARSALESLDMFIRDSPDPGSQALGDRFTLAQALITVAVSDGGDGVVS